MKFKLPYEQALEQSLRDWLVSPFPCYLYSGYQGDWFNMKEVVGLCTAIEKEDNHIVVDVTILRGGLTLGSDIDVVMRNSKVAYLHMKGDV